MIPSFIWTTDDSLSVPILVQNFVNVEITFDVHLLFILHLIGEARSITCSSIVNVRCIIRFLNNFFFIGNIWEHATLFITASRIRYKIMLKIYISIKSFIEI